MDGCRLIAVNLPNSSNLLAAVAVESDYPALNVPVHPLATPQYVVSKSVEMSFQPQYRGVLYSPIRLLKKICEARSSQPLDSSLQDHIE